MISIEREDKIDIITFTIDKITALVTEELRTEINKVFETLNAKVVIDLKGVEYIDSSGFGCLLSILRNAKNNYGILKFANPEPQVLQTLKMLNLHTVFDIHDSIDSCRQALR